MRARKHAHEGRLARPVAADQADDLAGLQVDGDVAHGMDTAKGDIDVPHLDERSAPVNRRCRTGLICAHEPRLRLSVSRPTATISTMPTAMFWPGDVTLRKLRP